MSCLTWSDMNIDETEPSHRDEIIAGLLSLAEEIAQIREHADGGIPGAMRWRPEDGKVL